MTKNLPLIRLSAINPFLIELRHRSVNVEPLLSELGLPGDIPVAQELFVPSLVIYEFIERSAELAGDRYLGYHVGSALDLNSWDPISRAVDEADTVGDLLTRFVTHAADHSSATKFYMRIDGDRTTFGLERVRKPPFRPGQIDAFYYGFMSRLFFQAIRENWDANEVLFYVAKPECIPSSDERCRIAQGAESGVLITFPSAWLFERFEKPHFHAAARSAADQEMPRSFVDSVRTALRPHLHESDLTVEKAAKICGHKRRSLARELRSRGTSLSKEIAKLRAAKAERELADTDLRVAEIARRVGFADPTVFSRAFKNWTGKSPKAFRTAHQDRETQT